MKEMKCPHCKELSTFTHEWSGIAAFSAPVVVDGAADVMVDYDSTADEGVDAVDSDGDNCHCDKCGECLSIDDIEVVGADEEDDDEVPAE